MQSHHHCSHKSREKKRNRVSWRLMMTIMIMIMMTMMKNMVMARKKKDLNVKKGLKIPRLNLFSRPDVTLLCEDIETGLDIESGDSDLYFESGDDGNERSMMIYLVLIPVMRAWLNYTGCFLTRLLNLT